MRVTRQSLIVATAVLCAILCALAWFLLVSPKHDEAQATRDETTALASSNDLLEVSVADLRDKFARIDEYKAQLAAAQAKLPADLDMAKVVAEIELAALANGVTLSEVTPSDGQAVLGDAFAKAPDTSPDAAASETAAATSDGAAEVLAKDLVAYPVSLTIYGSYDETTAFVSLVQSAFERYVLVSGTQIEAMAEAPALPDGTPALEPGDVKMIVNAYVYALPATSGEPGTVETEPVPLPGKPEGKDILAPQPVAAP